MPWEDPDQLLLMKLGREEYCQRMLTSLILGGPYPKWNTRNIPSESGFRFLDILHHLDDAIGFPIQPLLPNDTEHPFWTHPDRNLSDMALVSKYTKKLFIKLAEKFDKVELK